MALQKKRVTKGMFSADGGEKSRSESSTTKKLNRPVAGLSKDQMKGGDEADEVKNVKKAPGKGKQKRKAPKTGGGLY